MDLVEDYQSDEGRESIKVKYEILEKVSEGQFGTVFRAVNKENNEIVAIKKLYVSLKSTGPNSLQVQREIKCMTRLNHPNVIKLLDHQVKETSVKLVLDYMDFDLRKFIETQQYPLKNSKVKGLAKMILEGLDHIHSLNMIHRDLKPQNILINQNGDIKIGDFGSAALKEDQQNGQFEIEGFSQWYKAPEIMFGSRTYDERVDIWSFACIFGELINGAPLFPGMNDFDQISRIMKVIGSPTKENWSDLESLPDYGKVIFNEREPAEFEQIFPNATKSEISFLKYILAFERPKSVKEILQHKYFTEDYPQPSKYKLVTAKKDLSDIKTNYQALLKF